MNVVNGVNKFLESKATAATVFGVTGLSRIASDYKNAPDNKKNYALLHDSIILGASALGVGAYSLASKKIVKSRFVKKHVVKAKQAIRDYLQDKSHEKHTKKVLGHAEEVVSRCADNTLMLGTGILSAIGADYVTSGMRLDKRLENKQHKQAEDESLEKIYETKNKLVHTFQDSSLNKNLGNTVGSDVRSSMYNRVFDFPAMKMFTTSLVGMQGFEVIEEKTFKSRMKHATKCLIANSVVPVFFLSTATTLTKNMKGLIRLPLTFATMIFGTMYTNKFLDKHQYKASRKSNQPQVDATKTS
jgi:hypothetical protein